MQILTAKHCGFCYGVKRAVSLALDQAAQTPGSTVYTLGPIIHNPQVVSNLHANGIIAVDDIDQIPSGSTVIIRSHGVGPQIYKAAEIRGLKVVDATCPHVKKAQQAAKELFDSGCQVIVIGEAKHPEVKGIVAWTDNQALTVENAAEAEDVALFSRIGLVAQTTFSEQAFAELTAILQNKTPELVVKKTICTATEQRQQAAAELAQIVDVMLVIGGKNSANTAHLVEICAQYATRTLHIETAEELKFSELKGKDRIGITAGASTPDWIIEEVLERMQNFNEMLENHLQNVKSVEVGSLLRGKVVAIRETDVFVDIGFKGEAVIELSELAYPTPERPEQIVQLGEELSLLVLSDGSSDGSIKLSRKRIQERLAWEEILAAQENHLPLEAHVTEAVKGGVRVAVNGVSGFIPASHVALGSVSDLNTYVGQTLTVFVIEAFESSKKLVLSHKTHLRQQQELQAQKTLQSLTVGSDVTGTVRRLADFGAFVDLGGIDGLIHISDLAWQRVKSPSEVLNEGDNVKVRILKVDLESKRISLSLKDLQPDPWLASAAALKAGMIVDVTVTRLAKFGAFVKVLDGVEGLIRLAELSEKTIHTADEAVTLGQTFPAKILEIEPATKRLTLSVTQIKLDAERAEYQDYLTEQQSDVPTLGDKFAHLFSQLEKK
ncbi:bifunctional 4-hydroxy-3-methylbut-2-enyl diphosphate reductase/30S ribosomal protein S1 [Azotosporobacter soli]|uniref:bifunctional 4-hydroxy-3-methylbut-2-enyl diphosphate reductase/30S ribosomal protein S1 n=1 Tax=Azotosporobacter soli TaxID=3055040 RepID=UPI0031FED603